MKSNLQKNPPPWLALVASGFALIPSLALAVIVGALFTLTRQDARTSKYAPAAARLIHSPTRGFVWVAAVAMALFWTVRDWIVGGKGGGS